MTTLARTALQAVATLVLNATLDGENDDARIGGLFRDLLDSYVHVDDIKVTANDISPTQLVANTNDWAPTSLATASVIRATTDASRNLTGLTTGSDGREMLLLNVGSFNLVLKNEDSGSTAANRFALGGVDVTLAAGQGVRLWYDSTSSRWRLVGSAGGTAFTGNVTGEFDLSGEITPAQLVANTNDWAPTGLSGASVIRASTDASRNVTGLTGGALGRIMLIRNVGAQPLVLTNEDAASTAANRFTFSGGNLTIAANQGALVRYDSTTSRWREVAVPPTASTFSGDVTAAFNLSGDISPTQLVANTNDWAPTSLSTASTIRLNTDASRNITGLTGGADGRILVLRNVGSFNAVITNEDAASAAANRFTLSGGNLTLAPNQALTVQYDATTSRWREVALPPSAATFAGDVTGAFARSGDISPAQLTADQNDYAPAGFATCSVVRLDADATPRALTGLAGGADGKRVTLKNVGTGYIRILPENVGSTAANRFNFHTALGPKATCEIEYDSTLSRWFAVQKPAEVEVDWGATTTGSSTADRFMFPGFGAAAAFATENNSRRLHNKPGIYIDIRAKMGDAASAQGLHTFVLRVAGADTALTNVVPISVQDPTATTLGFAVVTVGQLASMVSRAAVADGTSTGPRVTCTFIPDPV